METFVGWKQTRKFYNNWFKISAWQNDHEVFKKSKVYATNNKNELKKSFCTMRKPILKKTDKNSFPDIHWDTLYDIPKMH